MMQMNEIGGQISLEVANSTVGSAHVIRTTCWHIHIFRPGAPTIAGAHIYIVVKIRKNIFTLTRLVELTNKWYSN